MKKILFMAAVFCAASVIGCSDDDNASTTEQNMTVAQKLTGIWTKTKKEGRLGTTGAWADYTQPCDTDDTQEFRADGAYFNRTNNHTCSGESPSTYYGDWELAENDSHILISSDMSSVIFDRTIIELTPTKLIIERSEAAPMYFRDTFVKN